MFALAVSFCALVIFLGLLVMRQSSYGVAESAQVEMRDGVKLDTQIYKPANRGKWPTVFMKGYRPQRIDEFVQAGYVFVSQGAREESTRFFNDGEDGYDTVEWIAKQPWSNGKVAMYGRSYYGMTQWLTARLAPPHLKAIAPQNMNPDMYQLVYRNNGALNLAMTAPSRAIINREAGNQYGWEKAFMFLPLIDLDVEVSGRENDLWNDYVTHSTFDDYWKAISLQSDDYGKIRIPVLNQGGWYDYYVGAALTSYQALREVGAAQDLRVTIGATNHNGNKVGDRPGLAAGAGNQLQEAIRWFDYVLKDPENGLKNKLPIQIFVMGKNEWRGENEWPLARTQFTKYYFHSSKGDRKGGLNTQPPGDETPSQYTYDPRNPVRSIGGNHSADGRPWHLDAIPGVNLRAGSYDQSPNQNREDVLVFSTERLSEDTEVTGPVEVKLYAATDRQDTDWIARLVDIYPDGKAYNLTEGVLRARFRKSIYADPKLLEPGQVYEYSLKLLPTSNVFLQGHKIGVHLTSSNWPLVDRNPNTGSAQGMDAKLRVANQTIYHDQVRPSHIVLPIVPTQ